MHPEIISIILMALRLRPRPAARSLQDLYEDIDPRAYGPWWWPYPLEDMFTTPLNGKPEEAQAVLRRHLEGMEALGLVIRDQETNTGDETTRWRAATYEELNEQVPHERRDSGGNGRGPDERGGGGGNGDGGGGTGPGDDIGGNSGGGIREVLGHKYLFALPPTEFDTLVDGIFDGPGAL
jgi:hypothetical protein